MGLCWTAASLTNRRGCWSGDHESTGEVKEDHSRDVWKISKPKKCIQNAQDRGQWMRMEKRQKNRIKRTS